jgi:hypothetical protein
MNEWMNETVHLPNYRAIYSTRPQKKYSLQWEPQVSYFVAVQLVAVVCESDFLMIIIFLARNSVKAHHCVCKTRTTELDICALRYTNSTELFSLLTMRQFCDTTDYQCARYISWTWFGTFWTVTLVTIKITTQLHKVLHSTETPRNNKHFFLSEEDTARHEPAVQVFNNYIL